jgi:transposase-like protein
MTLETLLEEEIRSMVGGSRWARIGSAVDVLLSLPAEDAGDRRGHRRLVRARGLDPEDGQGHRGALRGAGGEVHREPGDPPARAAGGGPPPSSHHRADLVHLLDGTFLDARWARKVENVAALVAYGVGPDERRRLLGITIGAQKSEKSWTELLRQLTERGLTGVKLVIADAHAGLASAVRHHLPEAKLQRCVVHLQRNALAQTPWRLRGRHGSEITTIFAAQTVAEARKRLEALRAGLGKELPEAMATLDGGFGAATQFYAFPRAHWRRIKTTNGLERLHAEIKRRTKAAGAFPDRTSALRLITAVAIAVTAIWGRRVYLDMSHLNTDQAKAA